MALATGPYQGQDLIDWEEGNKFLPRQYYSLSSSRSPVSMAPTTGITSTSVAQPYILPYGQPTGGEGLGGLGGKWGNLDMSKSKMFDKNVFSTDMVSGPPSLHQKMTGSFKPQQVQGFYNPTLGQYQTLEGKNINHLGLNIKPIFGSILESMGVGGKKNKLFDHDIGAIEGTFTHGWDSGLEKIKEGWEDEKEKWSNVLGLTKYKKARQFKQYKKELADQQAIDDWNKQQAQNIGATTVTPQHHGDISRGPGGGGGEGHQAQNIRDIKDEGPGVTASSGMHGGRHYAQGGRARFFYGGLAGIL